MKVPSKFFELLGAGGDEGSGIPDPLLPVQLTNPNIYGFRWRQAHNAVQTALNTFDWSAPDAALAACVASGKIMGLSVGWGTRAADWVYDTVDVFNLDAIGNEVGTIPNIFDPDYLPLLLDFIATFGALYDPHPAVAYTVVSGCMQHYEGYLAKSALEETQMNDLAIAAGFDDLDDGWWTLSQQIISAYVEAFPNTAVLFTSARPYPSDTGSTGVRQRALRDWITDTYPGHAGWMTAQLHAAAGGPFPPPPPVNWPHGFQAINNSLSDLERFYGTGNVPDPPPVPPQPMEDFINNGLRLGAQFLEIYTGDMRLAANQATYAERAPEFESFTDYVPPGDGEPPPPPPPDPEPPPVVIARPVVPRIIQCRTGVHARNIILARKRLGPPVEVPVAPGPIEILTVTTPHEPSSGTAIATFLSPIGSDPAELDYQVYVTGGPGTATVIARIPV